MYKSRIVEESLKEAKDLFEAGLLSECEYNNYIKLIKEETKGKGHDTLD